MIYRIKGEEENIDQVALRKWIEMGLSIPEVKLLNGDARYLLNNMIAKYTLASNCYSISKSALKEFKSRGIDLFKTHTRRAFYGKQGGKNPFIYEHAVPAVIVREQLISQLDVSDKIEIQTILSRAGQVAVLLRSENKKIRGAGLTSKMPQGWSFGDDPLARYKAVGIKLSSKMLKVKGAICR